MEESKHNNYVGNYVILIHKYLTSVKFSQSLFVYLNFIVLLHHGRTNKPTLFVEDAEDSERWQNFFFLERYSLQNIQVC